MAERLEVMAADDEKFAKARAIKFHVLCARLERAASSSKTINKQSAVLPDSMCTGFTNTRDNIYPYFRLICPDLDTERGAYGLKENSLAKLFCSALCLPPDSTAGSRLMNPKRPTADKTVGVGDFCLVLEDVLAVRTGPGKEITVGEVNDVGFCGDCGNRRQILTTLWALSSKKVKANAGKERHNIFVKLLGKMNANEFKWFARIVLKDLKLGIKSTSIVKFVSKLATLTYSTNTKLSSLCDLICEGVFRKGAKKAAAVRELTSVKVWGEKGEPCDAEQPMHKLKPMLAKMITNAAEVSKSASLLYELKLDGERLMVHITDHEKIMLHSRNQTDYSKKYASINRWILSGLHAQTAIFDGELIVWNDWANEFEPFGGIKSMAKDADAQADIQALEGVDVSAKRYLCFVAFDLLYVDGIDFTSEFVKGQLKREAASIASYSGSIIDKPLHERRLLLKAVLEPVGHHVMIIKSRESRGIRQRTQETIANMEWAVSEKAEGLVIKDLASLYSPNMRPDEWQKLKPQLSNASQTVDLVVLGGYFGEGQRRAGGMSSFLLGAFEEEYKEGKPFTLVPVGKVGSGYSIKQLQNIRERLGRNQRLRRDDNDVPPRICSGWKAVAKKEDRPDVWITDFSKSVVFEVYGQSLEPTRNFPSGFTIRFPRVKNVRTDKPWTECETVDTFRNTAGAWVTTHGRGARRGNRGNGTVRDFGHPVVAPPTQNTLMKAQKKPAALREVSAFARPADTSKVSVVSAALEGMVFCVYVGAGALNPYTMEKMTKNDFERAIHAMGGTVRGSAFRSSRSFQCSQSAQNPILLAPSTLGTHQQKALCSRVVIGDPASVKVKNLIKAEAVDLTIPRRIVLRPEWLCRCIKEQRYVHFTSRDLVTAPKHLLEQMQNYEDRCSMSMYEDFETEAEFHEVMDWMEAHAEGGLDVDPSPGPLLSEEDASRFLKLRPVLYGCRVYLDEFRPFKMRHGEDCESLRSESWIYPTAAALIVSLGGTISSTLDDDVHYVLSPMEGGEFSSPQHLQELVELLSEFSSPIPVVGLEWLERCRDDGCLPEVAPRPAKRRRKKK